MKEKDTGLNKLYKQRENFIVIGLPGRIGSGSSQVAEILEKKWYWI